LQTCGCNPEFSPKLNKKDHIFRLLLTPFDLQTLTYNGFETNILKMHKDDVQKESSHFIKPVSVTTTGRIDDTYCFTEHKRNAGVFNGVFTSQCLEITEPSNPDMISSCNLGHLNLKKFVLEKFDEGKKWHQLYDFKKLAQSCKSLVCNINKVIDYNYYPLDKRDEDGKVIKRGKISQPNFDNRPLGIGVSGLAEVFALMGIAYESKEAIKINKIIFACIYYNCLEESLRLAKSDGMYKNFNTGESQIYVNGHMQKLKGSPISNGYFQFDLWKQEAQYLKDRGELNEKIYNTEDNINVSPYVWGQNGDWDKLRSDIMVYGVRNSMLVALMPTASSAQLLRNAETTEAHQTLIYSRKLTHGNYTCFSEPFVKDMESEGFWNQETIDFIMMENGSIKNFHRFFRDNKSFFSSNFYEEDMFKIKMDKIKSFQKIHKGMFEISQKVTMEMCRQRGIYVCQSQSFNIYIPEPTIKTMQSIHNYSNALQLKTGMYYLRQNPASQTGRFTVDLDIKKYHDKMKKYNCDDDVCLMCQ
jgi:ribonucleoside-diphosphate reductase alpha chain